MRAAARALRRLGWRERVFVARAAATAGVASGLIRVAPLPVVVRLVAGRARRARGLPPTDRLVALTDRVLRLDRGPLRPSCVLRSLVLLRYLPEPVVLRFGVRPDVRPLDGHAWVERDGRAVSEPADPHERYQVTWSWTR